MAATGLVPVGPRLAAWPSIVAPRGRAPWRRQSFAAPELAVNHRSTGTSPVVSPHGDEPRGGGSRLPHRNWPSIIDPRGQAPWCRRYNTVHPKPRVTKQRKRPRRIPAEDPAPRPSRQGKGLRRSVIRFNSHSCPSQHRPVHRHHPVHTQPPARWSAAPTAWSDSQTPARN